MTKRPLWFRRALVCLVLIVTSALSQADLRSAAMRVGDTPLGRAVKRAATSIAEFGSGTMFVPTVTATLVDSFPAGGDVDSDGKADPGDTIRYTTTVAVSVEDATGVVVNVPIDANTTLVGTSISVSPVAVAESYQSVGNMTLTSANIGADCIANPLRSVTCNDFALGGTLSHFGPNTGSLIAVNGTNTRTTTGGGTVLLNTNGTFVYDPLAGFEGTDTFIYRLTSGGTGAPQTSDATVSIVVGGANGMAWFVNESGGGTGGQANPITLDALRAINNGTSTNPAANDTILVLEGDHALTATLTLLTNQKLLGQDITGTTFTALGAPAVQLGNSYPPLNPSGEAPEITSSAAAITLGSNNEIAGFTVGNAATTAITGGAVGDLNVREVTINTNGGGFVVTTSGVMTTTAPFTGFTSITSTGGTNGVSLTGVTGTFAVGSGAISGASGTAFNVSAGSAAITYGGTITQNNAQRVISVSNTTGGSVSFTNASANALVGGASSTGILIDGAAGSVTVNNADLNGTRGIEILGDAANNATGTYTFNNVTIDTPAGATNHAFIVDGDQGTATNNDVSATIDLNNVDITNPGGQVVSIQGMNGGSTDFDADSAITRNDGGLGILATSNAAGTVTFNSSTLQLTTSTNPAVALTSNTGATFSIAGGLDIDTTTGIGFNASGGGTINVSGGTRTINTTTGQAVVMSGVAIGSSNVSFGTIALSGSPTSLDALSFVSVTGNTFNGGDVTVTSTTTAGDGIEINASSAAFSFASATIDNTAGAGINLTGSNGAVTFTTVNIDGTTGAGIDIATNTNAVSVNGGTIGATNDPGGNVVGISAGSGGVTIAAALTKNGAAAGRIVQITGRTGTATIDVTGSLNCSSACTGINVANNTSGTTTINFSNATKNINTAANPAVSLDNNDNAVINFTNGGLNIDTTSGTGFTAINGGVVNVSGAANNIDTTGGGGINWNGNTSTGTVTFNNINSTTGNAVSITSSGASDFTFNDVTATTGAAVTITTATGDFVFHAINANGGAKGISVNSATGTFTVNGDSTTDGSGGTIQNATSRGGEFISSNNITLRNMNFTANGNSEDLNCGDGLGASLNTSFITNAACESNIHLQSTTTVVLNNVNTVDSGSHGIVGVGVNGLTLTNVEALRNGSNTIVGEDGVQLVNLSGTVTVTGGIYRDNSSRAFEVQNNSGSATITIDGAFFGNTNFPNAVAVAPSPSNSTANGSVLLATNGTNSASITSVTRNSTFQRINSIAFFVDMAGNTSQNATFGQTGQVNSITTATQGVSMVGTNSGGLTASVVGNNINNDETVMDTFSSTNINFRRGGGVTPASGNWNVTIDNNNVGLPGNSKSGCEIAGCSGISADDQGSPSGTFTMLIQNNDIYNVSGGINVGSANAGAHTIRATIINNNVQEPDPAPQGGGGVSVGNGIFVFGGSDFAGSTFVQIEDNNVDGGWDQIGNGDAIRIRHQGTAASQFFVCNISPSPANATQAIAFLAAENPDTSDFDGGGAVFSATGAGFTLGYTVSSTCPMMLAEGGIEAAHSSEVAVLTPSDIDHIGAAAVARWAAAGLSPPQMAALRNLTFEMADLPGTLLAEIAGDRLRIDPDAVRAEWFVDATPMDDDEFANVASETRRYTDFDGAPAGRLDLLTAMMHEMGHHLGLNDSYATIDRDSLMFGHLTTGERRLPSFGQAARATTVAFHVADPLGRPGDSLVAPWSPAAVVAARGSGFAAWQLPSRLRQGYGGQAPAALVRWVSSELRSALRVPEARFASAKRPVSARGTAFAARQLPSAAPLARWVSSQLRSAAATTLAAARRVPDLMAATLEARSGETVNQVIGTIPAGRTVTVIFDVTVDAGRQPQYSAQGTVSGSNFSSVLTDDPDVGGANNPTITLGDLFASTTTLDAAPPSPQFVSEDVTLTATVTSEVGGPTPSGNVTFRETGVDITGCVNRPLDGSGEATCDIPGATFTAGAKSFTAHYGGGPDHDPSASAAFPYTYDDCMVAPDVTTGLLANDGAAGSLRHALAGACPGATITFSITGNVDIGDAGELDITREVTIDGPGAGSVTVRRVSALEFGVFHLATGVTATIRDITIRDGRADVGIGGGIWNDGGTLTVERVVVRNNRAFQGGGIYVDSGGTLVVRDSAVHTNESIDAGGGLFADATTTVINSTISGNTSNTYGGGVYRGTGAMTVINSTITNNRADADGTANGGGGGFNVSGTAPLLRNTIVAGNFLGAGSNRNDIIGAVDGASSSNLIGDGTFMTGVSHGTNGNLVGTGASPIDPLLSALAVNGGTDTHALLAGSPALDAGAAVTDPITSSALVTDQRGQVRPVDNPNVADAAGGDGSDIGAYEAPAPPTTPDLQTASDTGANTTDNLTNDATPAFDVAGVTIGASVDLLVDGVVTATGTAAATTIALTSSVLTEGPHSVTARQTVAGGPSPISLALAITIDTTVPSTPTIDLEAASDSGISNSDNLTNATTRVFSVGNTDLGIDVVLARNGSSVMGSIGTGGAILLSDDTAFVSGTTYAYTARQTDAAGNFADSSAVNVTIDNTQPTVGLTSAVGDPTGTSPIPVTVTFTEGVYGFTAGNLVAGNGTVGNFTGNSGDAVYTFELTPAGQGAVTVDIAAAVSTDAAGNANTAASQFTRDFDSTAPTAAITAVTPDPRNNSVSSITIVFNQAVTGVTLGDFTLTRDGGANLLTGSQSVTSGDGGITWTLNTLTGITATAGSYTLTLTAAGAGIEDLAGNALVADASDTWVVETTAPTVTINQAAGQADPVNGGTINFTAVFSEPINLATFTNTDIDLSAGTATSTTITITEIAPNNGTTFNVAFSGNSEGDLVASIPANAVEDLVGNLSAASTSTDNTVTIDTTQPDVAMTSAANDPTSVSPIPVTVTFTEDVNGFLPGDLVAGNGTISDFAGSGAVYTFNLTPTSQGPVTVNIAAAVATDNAGNANTAATEFSRDYDTEAPTAAITAVSPDPRSTSVSTIDIVFSQAVTGVTVDDFTLTLDGGGNLLTGSQNVTTSDNITWTLDTLDALTAAAGTYTLTLTAAGSGIEETGAGNALVTDATDSWVMETTPPTVTINQAASQPDPAPSTGPINFTAVFSEPINPATFTDADLDLSTGTAIPGPITITEIAPNDGTTFTVAFSGNSTGDLVPTIPAGGVEDLVGNVNDASTSTDNTVTLLECTTFAAVVTSTDDDGPGTLRAALSDVCTGGTITFDLAGPGPHTINVTTGALFVDRDVTIQGPTNERVILDGGGTSDLMFIFFDTTVRIERLTFANGYSPGEGAAIFNIGTVSIYESTFTGNVSEFDGGAITNEGIMGLANSTVSGNSALAGVGGGIFNCTDGLLFLLNTTITNNQAGDLGGGVYNITDVYIENTIVAGNTAVTDGDNLFDDDGGLTTDFGHNFLSGDPRLGPLQDNGGVTLTHAPLPGSPVIDAGDTAISVPVPLLLDQRSTGFERYRAGPTVGSLLIVDIGAVEADPSIEDISDKTTAEGTPVSFSFLVGDPRSAFEPFVVSSSNQTLLPDANVVITEDTPSSFTATVTPAAGQFGTTTVTITVSKIIGGVTVSMSDSFDVTVTPVANTPSVTNATTNEDTMTTSGLVITPNVLDGGEVTHFKITTLTGGTLFQNDGVTPIAPGTFITAAEGGAGLRFLPAPHTFGSGSVGVRASLNGTDAGLGGAEATGIVTILPVADTPSITNALTTVDHQTTSGLVITRNPLDGNEVTHYKITAISGGTLFQQDGTTPIALNAFITVAQGAAGLRFTPSPGSAVTGHVSVRASVSNTDGGLGGGTVTADIIVIGPFTDDPIVPGVTEIKLLHLLELRARVNAQRVRFGLGEAAFTSKAPGVSMITAQDLLQIRVALSEAYVAHGLTAPTYTDPGLSVGMVIKAVHFQELRAKIIALEGS